MVDYGCGSGILAILALKRKASHVIAVDIDEDTLQAAEHNLQINSVRERCDLCHILEIYMGNDRFPPADVTIANILPGALIRLVVPLWGLTKPGGLICLSGMRPDEFWAVREKFLPFVDI